MALDKATVARIAHLARIRVPEEELEPLTRELARILDWVEQLAEVDTRDVEPLRKVVDIPARFRDDVVTDGGRPEAILANAPRRYGNYFVVPKVVE